MDGERAQAQWERWFSRYEAARLAITSLTTGSWRAGLDLLFPPGCTLCDTLLPERATQPLICAGCIEQIVAWPRPACPRCAAPLPSWSRPAEHCPRCQLRKYAFSRALALGDYAGRLREGVIRMKQQAHEPLTVSMGHLLAQLLTRYGWTREHFDLVTPVPMHWTRRWTRGTNGAAILAEAVSRELLLPGWPRLLVCRRKTRKQGTLLTRQRFHNVRNAFSVNAGYPLEGRRVLLIDDILTTGATASEAARALRHRGAADVAVAVLARGLGLDGRSR